VERALERLLAEGIEALAVCLLNSYANPAHEERIAEIVRRRAPDLTLSVSAEVLPEIREYERTSTTVINAYVMPIVRRYLRTLRGGLDATGVKAPLLIMQSNGGLMTDEAAAAKPVHVIESGPAAGVVGRADAEARDGVEHRRGAAPDHQELQAVVEGELADPRFERIAAGRGCHGGRGGEEQAGGGEEECGPPDDHFASVTEVACTCRDGSTTCGSMTVLCPVLRSRPT